MARAKVHQQELATMAASIAAIVDNGTTMRDPGQKTRESLVEKTTVRGKKINEITDAVRLAFEVKGAPEIADQIVQHLASDDHMEVADEGWRGTEAGYFDRTAKVRFADGVVGEVQVYAPGMGAVKSVAHKIYKQARTMAMNSPEAIKAREQMQGIFATYKRSLPPVWQAVAPA